MSADFVTREETDLLLNGVSAASAPASTTQPAHPRVCDVVAQDRIERGRMPAVDLVHERFARLLRAGLYAFVRRTIEVAAAPAHLGRYGEFIDQIPPGNIGIAQVQPLGTSALFIFDASLVYSTIDTLFGGSGRVRGLSESREPTPTEQRILQRLLEIMFENYEKAWAPLHALKFEYVRSETNPRFAAVVAPNDMVVTVAFDIIIAGAGGQFHICLPYQPLEPLRDLLQSERSLVPGHGRRALDHLAGQVKLAEVELTAQLAQAPATLRQVVELKAGDVIPIDIAKHIVAHVGDVPVMECKYGVHNGRYALKVTRWVSAPHDLTNGESHV
jgi:flagellar motor switch protein FliM